MWCERCAQDVPGIGSAIGGPPICARCGRPVANAGELHGAAGARRDAAITGYDEWELDQNVRQLQAKVGSWRRIDGAERERTPAARKREAQRPRRRVDAAHAQVPAPHKPRRQSRRRTSSWAGNALTIGLMAFACGAALLVWAVVGARDDLWGIGLPFAVAGQAGIVTGLLLHVERIWQSSRDAAGKLVEVKAQLRRLERTASLVNTTHGTAAQAFYAHLSEEVHPQILLADLQGQLDMLATTMAHL